LEAVTAQKPLYVVDHSKNIKAFMGESKEYEELAAKLRSQVAAGSAKVAKMIVCVWGKISMRRG
jgi:hypothetical protein